MLIKLEHIMASLAVNHQPVAHVWQLDPVHLAICEGVKGRKELAAPLTDTATCRSAQVTQWG